jgi:hypothetical protein
MKLLIAKASVAQQHCCNHLKGRMNKKLITALATGLWMLALTTAANASITTFTDRSLFNAQGVIAFNSNFQDYGGSDATEITPGFSITNTPFTRGDVTYGNPFGIIGPDLLASGTFTYGALQLNVTSEMVDMAKFLPVPALVSINLQSYYPLAGSIATAPKYNMLGFDIGAVRLNPAQDTPIKITAFTDKGTYTSDWLNITNIQNGPPDFIGGIVSNGEYFTGFSISRYNDDLSSSVPGITNVTLGNATPSPEPASMLLLGTGIAGLMGSKLRRKKK